jgi:hypothetical protein
LAAVQKISNPFDFDHWQAIPRATNQIVFSAWQPMLKSKTVAIGSGSEKQQSF